MIAALTRRGRSPEPRDRSILIRGVLSLLVTIWLLATPSLTQASDGEQPNASPYDVLDQYAQVLTFIENTYVTPVDRRKLLEGSVRGMVAELDPHSAYMNPEEFRAFQQDTRGRFVGIGIEVDLRDGALRILKPIDGSPAQRAGLLPKDVIVAIDDWPTGGQPMDLIVRRIRGAPGSSVTLLIKRAGVQHPLSFTITRRAIHMDSVREQVLDSHIGYIHIKQFQDGTINEFLRSVVRLRRAGQLRGLILDLRTNPGGLVHEAALVADEFLDHGEIYSTRSRNMLIDRVKASAGGSLEHVPVVVMVNPLTASAAELLAASLQANGRAHVVGQRTYGKGSVQSIFELPDGAGLKLTTMLYYAPDGRALQANGVTPDILVKIPRSGKPSLPVQREENIAGHLRGVEHHSSHQSPPHVADIVLPGNIPHDPRSGDDPTLAAAFRWIFRSSTAMKH